MTNTTVSVGDIQASLNQSAAVISADSLLFHNMVHGNSSVVVVTEGGNVSSVAKTISELEVPSVAAATASATAAAASATAAAASASLLSGGTRPFFHVGFEGFATTTTPIVPPIITTTLANVGNHFNTATKRFTAPASGIYAFSFGYLKVIGAAIAFRANLYVNGIIRSPEVRANETSAFNDTGLNTFFLKLAMSDYVELRISSDSPTSLYLDGGTGMAFNYFSGTLV